MSFMEKLEELAWEKKSCEIIFKNNGERTTIFGKVDGIYDREDYQFLRLQSGQEIQLEMLIRVDGTPAESFC